jgi:hypothetical protein
MLSNILSPSISGISTFISPLPPSVRHSLLILVLLQKSLALQSFAIFLSLRSLLCLVSFHPIYTLTITFTPCGFLCRTSVRSLTSDGLHLTCQGQAPPHPPHPPGDGGFLLMEIVDEGKPVYVPLIQFFSLTWSFPAIGS